MAGLGVALAYILAALTALATVALIVGAQIEMHKERAAEHEKA